MMDDRRPCFPNFGSNLAAAERTFIYYARELKHAKSSVKERTYFALFKSRAWQTSALSPAQIWHALFCRSAFAKCLVCDIKLFYMNAFLEIRIQFYAVYYFY